jgi:hypothetical protein
MQCCPKCNGLELWCAQRRVAQSNGWVTPRTLKIYLKHLRKNAEYPCTLTGSEDFEWVKKIMDAGDDLVMRDCQEILLLEWFLLLRKASYRR